MKINDPMENQYTNPPTTIDLTRKTDLSGSSGLSAIKKDQPVQVDAPQPETPKKIISAEVVQGAEFDPKNLQPFDPTTIIPRKQKPVEDATTNAIFSQLDAAVEREKAAITQRHKELEAKMYEDYLEEQDNEEEGSQETSQIRDKQDDDGFDDDLDRSSGDEPIDSTDPVDTEKLYTIPDQGSTDISVSSHHGVLGAEEQEVAKEEDTPVKIIKTVVADYDSVEFEKDFRDDDDDDFDQKNSRPSDEEIQERERKEAQEILDDLKKAAQGEFSSSIFNKVDLRGFSIGKTPVKASSIIVNQEEGPKADWVLYETGKAISMSALSGPELIQLDPQNSSRNRVNTLMDIYKILYNHIVDSKKPSFRKWMMQTKYNDLDHIYFCIYKATFGSNNFLSYQCSDPDCKHIFIKKVGFDEIVRYKNDSVKERVQEILSQDTNNGIIKYSVDLIQASNTYVFGMRTPSLYNVAIENAGLSNSIIEKYGDMIDIISYIDSVYTIDYANRELVPVALPQSKEDDPNPTKTTIKKIKTLYRILRQLNSDEYYTLNSYALKAEKKASDDISYFIPEATCPECGTKIAEITEMSANAMLFTRHHLGAFASM